MLKYTASKQILHGLRKVRRECKLNAEWNFINEVLGQHIGGKIAYELYTAFWRQFDGIEFYSPTPLKTVPLDGFHFPVSMFDVEEV